ncbi:MAG TPA: putative sugar nucleotidyl transferase [Gemmatimonadaceae bacterium]|nr:putative sugar nucleotidyl transferase [Gemmatimonadaceae bacterium]
MSDLYFYDDTTARAFEPFALTRPVSELRAGALLLRERWVMALGGRVAGVVTSPHLEGFEEPWAVPVVAAAAVLPAGSLLINSRCAVALDKVRRADVIACDRRVAAVTLPRDVRVSELRDGRATLETLAKTGTKPREVQGRWIERVWDLVGALVPMLASDLVTMSHGMKRAKVDGSTKSPDVYALRGATIDAHTFFDTTNGPVYVAPGAHVHAFTRVVGPCYVGPNSHVSADRIEASSIGEVSKVHGEMSNVVFLGHANKSHDGFVGHSYLGRWVNLGAGTITSNLKNTYGSVDLWTPSGFADTGLQFLGTFFGDHVKTGIGTTLNTGTVMGAAATIYGGAMPPKAVPPFAWGARAPYAAYRVDKFLMVTERVMARRHVVLTDAQKRVLSAAFERRWSVAEPK